LNTPFSLFYVLSDYLIKDHHKIILSTYLYPPQLRRLVPLSAFRAFNRPHRTGRFRRRRSCRHCYFPPRHRRLVDFAKHERSSPRSVRHSRRRACTVSLYSVAIGGRRNEKIKNYHLCFYRTFDFGVLAGTRGLDAKKNG
jgi:hypothetical protein